MEWKLPEDKEKLFETIRKGLKNAGVYCRIVLNDNPPTPLWAVLVTATVFINQEHYTVQRQTPWYPEGKSIDAEQILKDIDSLSSVVATALGHKVFKV